MADTEGLKKDLQHQGHDFPHLPVGFYNIAVSDGGDRTVVLDHAFDPAVVEDAIDWLAGGRLRKAAPRDVAAYLREHGLAPVVEIARVFGLPVEKTERELKALQKSGQVEPVLLAGAPHWRTK